MSKVLATLAVALQDRLTDERLPYARKLADLLVKNALDSRIEQLIPLDEAVAALRNGLHDHLRSDAALEALAGQLRRALGPLEHEDRPLRALLPSQLLDALQAWVRRPWSPGQESVLAMLDHAPFQALVQRLVGLTVMDFTHSPSDRGHTLSKALGGLTRKAGKKSGGRLEAVVESLGHEVERKLEHRVEQFAEHAVRAIIHRLAEDLSDPARAEQQAELREGVLDGVLSLQASAVLTELERAHLTGAARLLRQAFASWLETGEGARAFEAVAHAVLEPNWKRTLREVSRENALEQVVLDHAPRIVEQRVRAFAASDEFAVFVHDVVVGEP